MTSYSRGAVRPYIVGVEGDSSFKAFYGKSELSFVVESNTRAKPTKRSTRRSAGSQNQPRFSRSRAHILHMDIAFENKVTKRNTRGPL
jgi:hypothetical protein